MPKKKQLQKQTSSNKNPAHKNLILFSGFIFLFTFIIYYLTLFPSLSPAGDGAELVTNARLLGINHPPGFPLYAITGHIFSFIPPGTIPFRLNLMSAFFSSLSGVFIFLSGYILFKNEIIALVQSLIFAFSYTFWKISTCTEVFSFNIFWASILFFLILYWREEILKKEKPDRIFYIFSLTAGFSLCHHHTIFLLFPAFLFIFAVTDKKIFTDRRLIIAILLFLLPLTLYIYLPLRATYAPMNWGATDLEGTIRVIARKGYGSLSLSADKGGWSGENYINNLHIYLKSFSMQFTPLLVPLIFAGLYCAFRKNKTIFISLLIIFILSGPFFLAIANPPPDEAWKWLIERFYLLSFLAAAFFMGYGMELMFSNPRSGKLVYLSLLFILFPLICNYQKVNNSNNYIYYDYIKNLMESLPENAILISTTDLSGMGIMYFQKVEGLRTDIKSFQYGLLGSPWYIKEKKKKYPDLFTMDKTMKKDEILKEVIKNGFPSVYLDMPLEDFSKNLICTGLAYKIQERNEPDPAFTVSTMKKLEKDLTTRNELRENLYNEFFTKETVKFYSLAYRSLGKDFQYNSLYSEAKKAFEKSLEIYELPGIYSDLAFIYRQEGNFNKAEELYLKALEKDSNNPDIYINLGILYLTGEDFKKSEEYFKKSLELDRENPFIYSNMAVLYEKQGDNMSALKYLEKALEIDSDNPDIHYNIAILMIKENRLEEGKACLKKARELGYPEEEIEKILNYIEENGE